MRKIGFIDLFIDEWHANNYPKMIRESRFKDQFDVTLAWEEAPLAGGKPLADWCREQNVAPAASIEQVVEDCDAIVVLAPRNPEVHARLAKLPLRSGKPVYIDKPFAPSLKKAGRIFERADKHATPLFSSSALRFGSGIGKLVDDLGGSPATFASTRGGGASFEEYGIHQIEMLVMMMGTAPVRVMQCGSDKADLLVVEFAGGHRAVANLVGCYPFQAECRCPDGKRLAVEKMDDFFPRLIDAMLEFFVTGVPPVPKKQTLAVATILQAGIKALNKKDTWVKVRN
jgi:GFO/IDH/MocA oxidoreductase family protein